MSEYQYYERQAVDRLLTDAEQEAVRNLSSHIEVSSSRAVVTYSYGDFKHDPRTVLMRFFDAHLYLAWLALGINYHACSQECRSCHACLPTEQNAFASEVYRNPERPRH